MFPIQSTTDDSKIYVDDVFSTYLYTGNGSTQTITNGIDLAGKGGLVWVKSRDQAFSHYLGSPQVTRELSSNSTGIGESSGTMFNAYNANGFTLQSANGVNGSGLTYASWTFRKAPKFFDVVTYTGNGVAGRTIAHNLGVAPGMIIVKSTSNATAWPVYHRSLGATKYLALNTTDAATTNSAWWNNTEPTATEFTVGTTQSTNQSGYTYVAYLFAHNAGGFGLTGTDNVISCGSYTGNGASIGSLVSLGYEPQWLLLKSATDATDWRVVDNMRGIPMSDLDMVLAPNTTAAETDSNTCNLDATGFYPAGPNYNSSGATYIYLAIRRGPMKTPTSGTSVFSPGRGTDATGTFITTGFPSDLAIQRWMGGADNNVFSDRLRGFSPANTTASRYLISNLTDAEVNSTGTNYAYTNTGFQVGGNNGGNWWALNFRRAPGFFDEVCYTGTGSATTVAHNLGVAPELMIVKARSISGYWYVFVSSLGADRAILLNSNGIGASSSSYWNSTMPTSTVFSLNDVTAMNGAGSTFVAYLFASCPGVSKVGSYTGNGSTQTINCGFTTGARFILIKRTDATGDWFVWDSARGIVAANDPHLSLNTTAAEVTTDDSVDPDNSGFIVNQVAATNINVSSATYIYLAIA